RPDPVNPQFGADRLALTRDDYIQVPALGVEESRPRQLGRRDLLDQLEFLVTALLDDGDHTFAAGRIQALVLSVEEQVVGVGGDRHGGDFFPRARVERDDAGLLAAADKNAFALQVEGHRVVRLGRLERVLRRYGVPRQVQDDDLGGLVRVDVEAI